MIVLVSTWGTGRWAVARLLAAALAVGCEDPPAPAVTDTSCGGDFELNWDNFGDAFFHTWCRSCHSADAPQRFDAPEGVDFDTIDEVRAYKDRVQVRVIDEHTMPLGGGISQDELDTLQIYLDCSL